MNTKAYNGVRYLSKNGRYYTENYIVVVGVVVVVIQ
jgi:hypothetical protein